MATIFELSPYNLYRLQSLDPVLDENYRDILEVIFPILDEKSQDMLLTRHLHPRGIHCDLTRRMFSHDKPATIEDLFKKGIPNSRLLAMAKKMQTYLNELPLEVEGGGTQAVEALDLAGHIEGLLHQLDKMESVIEEGEEVYLEQIRRAFLYELASLINQVHITIDKNKRGITAPVVKAFIKEVFIKHELQGLNFRAWDSDDFDALKLNHFPDDLKDEVMGRRLSIVETARYWFLIAPIRTFDVNRYSACRFLTEDTEYGLYITYGCYVPRHHVNPDIIQMILKLISTIYTLEVSASATLLGFMEDSRKAFARELQPLLRHPLDYDGDLEEAVAKRLEKYQKALDTFILSKMPNVMQAITNNVDDRAIFVHYTGVLFNNIWQDIQFFGMLPAVGYVDATEVLSARILCYRLFLKKTQDFYWDERYSWETKARQALTPSEKISELFDDVHAEQQQILGFYQQIDAYEASLAQGKFLAKLGVGRPKHTMEELEEYSQEVSQEFFLDIIRLAKSQRQFMVHYEFEGGLMRSGEEKDYRHYSTPTGKTGLDKLPLLARLPEKRDNFDVSSFELV